MRARWNGPVFVQLPYSIPALVLLVDREERGFAMIAVGVFLA
jgi:hypothetical protein